MLAHLKSTKIQFSYLTPSKDDINWLIKYDKPTQFIETNQIILLHSYVKMGLIGADYIVQCREAIFLKLNEILTLLPKEYSFCIFDAFRKKETQLDLFETTYNQQKLIHSSLTPIELFNLTKEFVVHPDETTRFPIPPHNSGGAIDLCLAKNGEILNMGTDFDEVSELSNTNWFEQDYNINFKFTYNEFINIRNNRRLLFNLMKNVGFINYESEWWHYDLGDCLWANTINSNWYYPSMEAE